MASDNLIFELYEFLNSYLNHNYYLISIYIIIIYFIYLYNILFKYSISLSLKILRNIFKQILHK